MSKVTFHAHGPWSFPAPGWNHELKDNPELCAPLDSAGIIDRDHWLYNLMAYAQPVAIFVILNSFSKSDLVYLKKVCPKTIVFGRWISSGRWTPEEAIREANLRGGPSVIDVLCTGNEGDYSPEPVADSVIPEINRLERDAALKIKAAGFKVGILSISYGAVDQIIAAPHRFAGLRECLEAADFVILHSYGANHQGADPAERSFAYREFYRLLPVKRPIAIKEYGPDLLRLELSINAGNLGWYLDALKARDLEWRKDDCLIAVGLWDIYDPGLEGGIGWARNNLARVPSFAGTLGGYIHDTPKKYWSWQPPIVSPPPAPTPVPAPTPQPSGWPKLRHFVPQEFKRPELLYHRTLILADLTREAYGPLRITGDHRTPEENTAVGGHPQSLHLKGKAIDLIPAGGEWDQAEMFKMAKAALAAAELMGLDKNLEMELDDRPGHKHLHLGVADDGRENRFIVKG